MNKRKLNTFIKSSKDWKFGDFIIFQEYSEREYDYVEKQYNYKISRPITGIFINNFVADQTIGFDFIKWTRDFPKDQASISCHIEWSDYIDVLGHFKYKPTWKEMLKCFRTQNFDKIIKSNEIDWK